MDNKLQNLQLGVKIYMHTCSCGFHACTARHQGCHLFQMLQHGINIMPVNSDFCWSDTATYMKHKTEKISHYMWLSACQESVVYTSYCTLWWQKMVNSPEHISLVLWHCWLDVKNKYQLQLPLKVLSWGHGLHWSNSRKEDQFKKNNCLHVSACTCVCLS